MYSINIYLVFSQTGTWLAKLLKNITGEKYVHVSISLDNDLNKMYSFGRINPNNPLSGGFVQEDLRSGVFKNNNNSECKIYKIKITKDQYDKLTEEIDKFVNSTIKYKYNLFGLITAALNIRFKRKRHYFCSQFVSEILISANVLNNDLFPELFKPLDFDNQHLEKEEIFRGYVRDYLSLQNNGLKK